MTDPQRNKLNMYVLVKDYLLASKTITGKWTAFAALFVIFESNITDIFRVSSEQEEDTTGLTKSKSVFRVKLEDKVLEVSLKCMAYGTVTEKYEFLSLVRTNKSELKSMPDANLLKKALSLIKNATPLVPEMVGYDLGPDEVSDIEPIALEFEKVFTKPEGDRDDYGKLTAELAELFVRTDGTLIKIDSIIKSGYKTEPVFVNEYSRRRPVVKRSTRKRSFQLKAVYDDNGEPLYRATVVITNAEGTNPVNIVKKTGLKGGITKNSLAVGEYNYEIKMGGLVTAQGSFFVNDGIMTSVVVRVKRNEVSE